jgi:hypothetical protein
MDLPMNMTGLSLTRNGNILMQRAKLASDNGRSMSKFNSDCEAAITAVKTKSQCLISDAKKIQSEMRSIDQRLSSIDKYLR